MEMKVIRVLYFSLFATNLRCILSLQLNGKCGYPGKPYKATLEPDDKIQYDEGEEVTYKCNDYWFQPQSRRCERGRWVGKPARCADFVKNVTLKDVIVDDISTRNKPITKFEYTNMNLSESSWKIPNAFAGSRFPHKLRIFGTNRHKWIFKFSVPTVKLFVKININFINYTQLSEEQKQNFTLKLKLFVSPHRRCRIDFQNEEKWSDNGGKINTFFSCDTFSSNAHRQDIKDPGDYMIMESESNVQLYYELLAILFGKPYGSLNEPLCGEPEVSLSHRSIFKQENRYYNIQCKSDKIWKQLDSESELKCVGDMKWIGSYPECLPLNPCPLDNLLKDPDSNRTIIGSLDDIYFYNESIHYAIEGTKVRYECQNPNRDILIGTENRVCFKNGTWSNAEPHCYDQNKGRKSSIHLVVVTIVGALIIVIMLISILFCVYTKRVKNKITKQITIQKRRDSSGYDDIQIPTYSGGKDMYNMYNNYENAKEEEVVEKVCYADPYYTDEIDYSQTPQNTQNQSRDDYLRLSDANSTHLELEGEPKPTSLPNVENKDPNIYYNN